MSFGKLSRGRTWHRSPCSPDADTGNDFDFKDETGQDYSKGQFYKVNMRGTIWKNANLRAANLFGSFAKGADFSGADLTNADLESVDFEGANLSQALVVEAEVIQMALILSRSRVGPSAGCACLYPVLHARFELHMLLCTCLNTPASATRSCCVLQTAGAQFRALKSIEGATALHCC